MTDGYYSQETFESLHFDEPFTAATERQLIAEWQHLGCLASRDTLVLRFALYASALANKFCGPVARQSPEDMQDMVSVANAALLRTADEFDLNRLKARFSSLLYLLVRRAVVNWVRAEASRPVEQPLAPRKADVTVSFAYPAEPGDEEETSGQRVADAEQLVKLLPGLPEDERQLLDLHFFKGYGLFKAGKELGKTQWEATLLKRSALLRLRELLEGKA